MNLPHQFLSTILLVALAWLPAMAQQDQSQPAREFLTGSELEKQNALAISAWWSKADLGYRLQTFSKTQRIGIFLDRRVDRQLPLALGLKDRTTEQVLWTVADQKNLGICQLGDFYFIGPRETAAKLPIVIDQLTRESIRQRKKYSVDWNQRVEFSMPPVVQPQTILQQLAADHGFQIAGLESLPHDTWARFELPATSLTIAVQTILSGFGKTIQRNATGDKITIVDLPAIDSAKREFTLPAGMSSEEFKTLADQLEQQFTKLKFRHRGKRLTVTGPPQELANVRSELVAKQQAIGVESGIKTYTLSPTTEFRGSILKSIGQQTSRQIDFPPDYQGLLNDRITIEAKNNSLEELLFKVLSGTDLEASLAPGRIIIEPK